MRPRLWIDLGDLLDAVALLPRQRAAEQQRTAEGDDADRLPQFVGDDGRPFLAHALQMSDRRHVLTHHHGAGAQPVVRQDRGGAHQQRHGSIVRPSSHELASDGDFAVRQGPHEGELVRCQPLSGRTAHLDGSRIDTAVSGRLRVHERPERVVVPHHLAVPVHDEHALRHLVEHRLQPLRRARITVLCPFRVERAGGPCREHLCHLLILDGEFAATVLVAEAETSGDAAPEPDRDGKETGDRRVMQRQTQMIGVLTYVAHTQGAVVADE